MAGFPPRGGHSSGTPIAGRLAQPTRATGPEKTGTLSSPRRPYSVLLPVGFAVPSPLPGPRWALTPPFHPDLDRTDALAATASTLADGTTRTPSGPRRSVFCGTVPEVALAGRYPAPSFRGARTFLPAPLSRPGAAARPTGGDLLRPPAAAVKGARGAGCAAARGVRRAERAPAVRASRGSATGAPPSPLVGEGDPATPPNSGEREQSNRRRARRGLTAHALLSSSR